MLKKAGIIGAVAATGVLAPLTGIIGNATSQANTLNCTNVQLKDLVDDNSNNDTTTVTERDIEDSFNRR